MVRVHAPPPTFSTTCVRFGGSFISPSCAGRADCCVVVSIGIRHDLINGLLVIGPVALSSRRFGKVGGAITGVLCRLLPSALILTWVFAAQPGLAEPCRHRYRRIRSTASIIPRQACCRQRNKRTLEAADVLENLLGFFVVRASRTAK